MVYVLVLWSFTSYSETTFGFLFLLMGIISVYEMWKLRKGKSKLIALLYVIIPFCIVQLFGFSDHNYPTSNFDPSPILIMFVLTWVFDTFAYLTGSKFGPGLYDIVISLGKDEVKKRLESKILI